jgi:hypothetical protein
MTLVMKEVPHPASHELRPLVRLHAVKMTEPAPPDTCLARAGLLPSDGERRVDAAGFSYRTRRRTASGEVWIRIVPWTAVGATARREDRRWNGVGPGFRGHKVGFPRRRTG